MKKIYPSMILSIIALVVAMSGASYAAGRYIITSVGQIKPHVRAELRGRRGPVGLQGPRGTQGLQGLQGATGATGPQSTVTNTYYLKTPMMPLDIATPNATAQANCPAGSSPVNGGFYGRNEIVSDDAISSSAWTVTAHLEAGQETGSIGAWVLCARD